MSRKYKFHNPDGIYFVSFAVKDWIDAPALFKQHTSKYLHERGNGTGQETRASEGEDRN